MSSQIDEVRWKPPHPCLSNDWESSDPTHGPRVPGACSIGQVASISFPGCLVWKLNVEKMFMFIKIPKKIPVNE